MLDFKFWHWVAFMALLPFLLGFRCPPPPPKTDPPTPPQYCGQGSGEYGFSVSGSIPTTLDCNTEGALVIELVPKIHSSYEGFNRLSFRLQRDWSVYYGNYVQFNSYDNAVKRLEWGGSLPSGRYALIARMVNIQLNSSCSDSIFRIKAECLDTVEVIEYYNPQKVMQIEYFCQESDTISVDRYNVFLSPNTEEYIDFAFNVANTTSNVITHQTDLTPELIMNSTAEIRQYISDHKQFDDEMFLCGIKGFKDIQGNLVLGKGGSTIISDTIYFTPSCHSGSLVAVKGLMNTCVTLYEVDYDDLVTAIAVHEIGHQRAILHHHDDFSNPTKPYCIMNQGQIYTSFNSYSNPHFCEECLTKINSITW
jgi:hypothetical protein